MHGRIDANQPEIVAALRAVGATVQSLTDTGGGCPDLLIGYRGHNYLLEIKTDTGKLRASQRQWHTVWRGQVATVRSIDEAFAVIGLKFSQNGT